MTKTKKQKINEAIGVLDSIITPDALLEAECLHKRMSRISADKLLQPFTK